MLPFTQCRQKTNKALNFSINIIILWFLKIKPIKEIQWVKLVDYLQYISCLMRAPVTHLIVIQETTQLFSLHICDVQTNSKYH